AARGLGISKANDDHTRIIVCSGLAGKRRARCLGALIERVSFAARRQNLGLVHVDSRPQHKRRFSARHLLTQRALYYKVSLQVQSSCFAPELPSSGGNSRPAQAVDSTSAAHCPASGPRLRRTPIETIKKQMRLALQELRKVLNSEL